MFLHGVIGTCKCGREVSVERDIADIVVHGAFVDYHLAHRCEQETITVPREVHRQAIAWFKKIAEGNRNDGVPVSLEERMLLEFETQLQGINTVADLEMA